jgi:hypothetical protein
MLIVDDITCDRFVDDAHADHAQCVRNQLLNPPA